MSAHVLLNLSNELRKINKMRGLQLNITRARMLDSFYHMTLKLLRNRNCDSTSYDEAN